MDSCWSNEHRYLIWSNEHRAWWGPGECGYVTNLSRAGHYSRDQALRICKNAIPTAMHLSSPMLAEIPVRLEDVLAFTRGGFMFPEGVL